MIFQQKNININPFHFQFVQKPRKSKKIYQISTYLIDIKILTIKMQLAIAIVTYIMVAFVLICFFCLATRYFNYRLRKSIQDRNQVYSMVDGIEGQVEDMADFEYQEFLLKRAEQKNTNKNNPLKNKLSLDLQMKEIQKPFRQHQASIYGPTLNTPKLSPDLTPKNSVRSLISPKNFMPEKLQNPRSSLKETQNSENKQKNHRKIKIISHKYISKIISYTDQGIQIIQNKVYEIWKDSQTGSIKQKRQVRKNRINPYQRYFNDFLEANGFEKGSYEAYKYQIILQIPNMKPHEVYPVISLKSKEIKESMNFHSFYYNKQELENSFSNYSQNS